MTRSTAGRTHWAWHVSALGYRWSYLRIAHRADEDLLTFLVGRLRAARVADCGCGPGIFAEKLAVRGVPSLVAVDGNVSMVRQARARLAPFISTGTVEVIHAFVDASFFGSLGRTFDAVVFKRSLYGSRLDAIATLRAAVASLEPRGVVVVLHPERSLRRYALGDPPRLQRYTAFHLVNRLISVLAVRLGISEYRTYTRQELVAMLAEAAVNTRVEEIETSQQAYNIALLIASDQPLASAKGSGAS